MFDIGQQQFLVLLLVPAAQHHQRRQIVLGQQRLHRRVHMRAVSEDLVERRARDHPAIEAIDPLPLGFVIGIEQERPIGVIRLVSVAVLAQEKRLEEPGRVRQMPFRRRGVFHRLQRRVGIAQRGGQRLG